jgi:hypothetical protein
LVFSGLLVQATAVGIGFTSGGWRWPIVGAGAAVSLGFLFVLFADGGKFGRVECGMLGLSVLTLALALAHGWSTHPAIVAFLAGGMALQAVIMILLLLFMLFFRMKRLF